MTRNYLDLVPLTLAIASIGLFGVACGDDNPGTEVGGETGDGDGDGDTGDGDGDGDTGDGDGDTGDGDGDEPPPPDSDGDGIPDPDDNCPADPNPNQLDFDGNGIGNVCDVQMFTGVTGTLNTTASAKSTLGNCQIPIQIDVTGGAIHIQLDDDAAIAGFEIVELNVADILDKECKLNAFVTANVSLKDFLISNSGDSFPVSMPHSLGAHAAGTIAGNSDMPHPVLTTATIEAAIGNDPAEGSPLELDGALPIFTANISGAGAMGTMSFADGQFVLAEDTFMIEEPIATDIDFELRGLVGTLTLTP